MRRSLGLKGDLDDVELVEDIEQAFGIRLPGGELPRCYTVGDLFGLVADQVTQRAGTANRCATAMCFYRLRRAVLRLAPDIRLHPSTSIEVLRGLSVRSLYHALRSVDGLRPPVPYVSAWGVLSLLFWVAAPIGPWLSHAPWWTAIPAMLLATACFRLSPVRLPPGIKTVRDLVELLSARNAGLLADQGARLRPTETWKALKVLCADHANTADGPIGHDTLLFVSPKAGE